MDKLDSAVMTHEEVQKVLPWYANKRLDAQASQRVEAHLAACPICRGDAEGLNAVLAAHEGSAPERAVNEARLDALFARIDKHEAQRRRQPQSVERVGLIARAMQWFRVNPALAAGSVAAVFLAVFMLPGLQQQPNPGQEFSVLSSNKAAAQPFVVNVRFATAPARGEVERLVAATLADSQDVPAYRIEQRAPTQFLIAFDSKPSVMLADRILTQLAGTPNVAAATIDAGSAGGN
jgi:anti-sigma factor RsiW